MDCDKVADLSLPDVAVLAPARHDLSAWLERLGCKLHPRDRPLVQYVSWCHQLGILKLLSNGPVSIPDVCRLTKLNEAGADALLGVLCGTSIAGRRPDGGYFLRAESREYFSPSSPFYVGDQLYAPGESIPTPYFSNGLRARAWIKWVQLLPSMRFGTKTRVLNQHVRNLPAGIAAARSGEFDGLDCLVDVAGGSGSFAVPLALAYPSMRIVLADLPAALKNVRAGLARYGLTERIELVGVDVFDYPWKIPECDGIFLGNFLHGFPDDACMRVCREGFERLRPGGKLWVHEMLWNANKDGPLITSLWNASMRASGGKQRSAAEYVAMLQGAGFSATHTVPTAAAFTLVAGRKPICHGERTRCCAH